MDLGEKLRPQTWEQVIGQDVAVKQIRRVADVRGFDGSAWWLGGPSGSGKTTLAKIMAGIYSTSIATVEFVGRDLLAEDVRHLGSVVGQPTFEAWGKRCWIVNEAQDIPATSVAMLLDVVEKIKVSKYDMVIFTAMIDTAELKKRSEHLRALITRCYAPHLAGYDNPEYRTALVDYVQTVADREDIAIFDAQEVCEAAGWSVRAALAELDMLSVLCPKSGTVVIHAAGSKQITVGDTVRIGKTVVCQVAEIRGRVFIDTKGAAHWMKQAEIIEKT